MSFVGLVSEEQAEGQVKQLYQQIRKDYGFLPNYFQALGRSARLIEGHLPLGASIMEDGALPRPIKEQIALVVSGINSSSYCIAVHMEMLHRLGVEKRLGRKLATDYENAPVPENVKALFRFADKLTRKPFEIEQADAEAVRQASWNDDAIVETVLTVGLFNLYNRVSSGLGLVADF